MGMEQRWRTSRTTVTNLGYHIVWCTKYRRKVINDELGEYLKTKIREKCAEQSWEIESVEAMFDHVHIHLRAKPTDSVAYIVAQLKGYTSREMKNKYPWLRKRLPSLWTRSYYAESVGIVSVDRINRYINNQKKERDSSHD